MNETELAQLLDKVNKAEHDVNLMSKVLEASNNHHRFIVKCLSILLGISIFSNVFTVGAFVWYESQYDYVYEEELYEHGQDQSVSGDNSNINNVGGNQYNDNATHNQTE